MKPIEDIRIEMKVGDMIIDLVRKARDGKLDDMPNGDVQGVCEVLAINIINLLRGNDDG